MMSEQPSEVRPARYTGAEFYTFGSIDRPLTDSIFQHLTSTLGLEFDDEYDENAYLVGIRPPDDHGIKMWAVRHFDTRPGLVIQLAWDERPSDEILMAKAGEIRQALESLPQP